MGRKSIMSKLDRKFKAWLKSIEDENVRKLAEKDGFITGGAIVSLLNGEQPNDIDVYFLTKETTLAVAEYYAEVWNKTHKKKVKAEEKDGRIRMFVQSTGIASEEDEDERELQKPEVNEEEFEEKKRNRKPYRPVFLSSNAISLADDVQLIIRFYGTPEEVHKSFDFVHCTCWYHPYKKQLELPAKALEAIIMKDLVYVGSKYPIASILRAKKFIKRGWKINAGQYLKMVLQVQELDLTNAEVLEDQLTGVDFWYFQQIIQVIREKKANEPDFKLDATYVAQVVDRIFDGLDEEADGA